MTILNENEFLNFLEKNNYNGQWVKLLKKNNPDTYSFIDSLEGSTISEKAYFYIHKKFKYCLNCNNKTIFINIRKGFSDFCSITCNKDYRNKNSLKNYNLKNSQPEKCKHPDCTNIITKRRKNGAFELYCSTKCKGSGNSIFSREKSKQTMLKNYGVEHALQSTEIVNNMKQNNMQKYGVEHIMHKKEFVENQKKAMLEKYGFCSTLENKERYLEQLKKTCLKFGYKENQFTNISQIPEIQKIKETSTYLSKDYSLPDGEIIKIQGYENYFLDKLLKFIDVSLLNVHNSTYAYEMDGKQKYFFPDFEIFDNVIDVKSDYTFQYDMNKNINKAKGILNLDKKLQFIIFNKQGECLQNITFSKEKEILREALKPSEENIFIDDVFIDFKIDNNLFIYRDTFFTSEIFIKDDLYLQIVKKLRSKNYNVYVINSGTVNSVLLNTLLHKIKRSSEKVYARNTKILKDSVNVVNFLNKNHIQGYAPATHVYKLFHNNEVVAIMTFNKFRKGIGKNRGDNCYELVRYATSMNIIGGASKLLKFAINDLNAQQIYSYSDNSISNGDLYKILNFELEKEIEESYLYRKLDNDLLEHRFKYRKGNLKNMSFYDETLSERDIMKINGYLRFYDCGKKTWILNTNEK